MDYYVIWVPLPNNKENTISNVYCAQFIVEVNSSCQVNALRFSASIFIFYLSFSSHYITTC